MLKTAALVLLMLGDLNFTGLQYMTAFSNSGYDPGFSFNVTEDLIRDADIAVANLEGPLTFADWSKETDGKKWRFRQLPLFAQGIKKAGIDILLLGNNHIADAGDQGIQDTIAVLKEEGLIWIPPPREGPLVVEKHGFTVELWNADVFSIPGSHPWAVGREELVKIILQHYKLKKGPRIVVAFIHAHISDERQAAVFSDQLRNVGINWVILGGEHRPGGMKLDQQGGAHYGLGDFIFGCECSGATQGKALSLTIKADTVKAQETGLELGAPSNGFITRVRTSGVVPQGNTLHFDQ